MGGRRAQSATRLMHYRRRVFFHNARTSMCLQNGPRRRRGVILWKRLMRKGIEKQSEPIGPKRLTLQLIEAGTVNTNHGSLHLDPPLGDRDFRRIRCQRYRTLQTHRAAATTTPTIRSARAAFANRKTGLHSPRVADDP